ncbi:MAG: hypothetical protein Q9217_002978 [Psora testacea]
MVGQADSHVWEDWQKHCSVARGDTLLAILNSLRRRYPEHIVTVAETSAGLLPYADAGNAQATLDNGDEKFVATREYKPTDRRSEVDSSNLKDNVKFGRYDYTWKDSDFIVYYADWIVDYVFGRHEQYYFILYQRSGVLADDVRPKAVDELIAAATKWNTDLHKEVWVFDQERWVKNTKLWKSVQQSNWEDVILDADMKSALINDVEGFFDNEAEYREFAVPFKRGIILHGSPGNGKSLSIKALMHSLSERPYPIPTLYVKSFAGCHNDFYAIREVFEKARDTSPCLLIFEDLDSLVKEKVRSFFLNEVDGLEDNDGLMIIGSTNYLEKLDPSITKRPSRFDRKYHFALPATTERVRYCEYWRSKLDKNRKIQFPEKLCTAIADITVGFSFAYLKEAFITSLLAIVGAQRTGVTEIDGVAETNGTTNGHANGNVHGHEDVLLWRVMSKQVKILRGEMEDARKNPEEAGTGKWKADGEADSGAGEYCDGNC